MLYCCPQCFWVLGLQTWTRIYTISSLVPGPLNHTIGFPGSPACRWQIVGLCSLHDRVSHTAFLNLYMYDYTGNHT